MVWKAAVALVLIASPAHAWDKIDLSEPNSCGFSQIFEGSGETTVMVLQSPTMFKKGFTAISFQNDNWSVIPETEIADKITVRSEGYEITARAIAANHGFLINIDDKMLGDFARSNPATVSVLKGKTEISRLNFDGFALAHAMFIGCSMPKITERENRERLEKLEKEIPRDPFAQK